MSVERREYEMTAAQLDKLLEACRPVPYLIIGGMPPPSQQESANDAWARLGLDMGFDPMTVKPMPSKGYLFFTAIPTGAQRLKTKLLTKLADLAKSDDTARAHKDADAALLDYISDSDIAKAFEAVAKWYE